MEYLTELCRHHVGGHLKVAPEHIAPGVLSLMNKPGRAGFDAFRERFSEVNRRLGKEQYLLPYFLSGHPGSTVEDMIALAEYVRDESLYTEQAQDFTPTPMTAATCMYHTGNRPGDRRRGPCAQGEGEGDPAGHSPLPGPGKGRSREGRPGRGREGGPHGERVELPHPGERRHPYQGKEKIFTITITKYVIESPAAIRRELVAMIRGRITEREGNFGKVLRTFVYESDGITEHEGERLGKVKRSLWYESDGKTLTERKGGRDGKVIRTVTFETDHAIEWDMSPYGKRKSTYLFDPGEHRILEREGGKYGTLLRGFLFEPEGILEGEGGGHGPVRRMFAFDKAKPAILERTGGHFGDIKRTLVFEGMDPSVLRNFDTFLEFVFLVG